MSTSSRPAIIFTTQADLNGFWQDIRVGVEYATEDELKDFANTIREAGGANVIEAFLPAKSGSASECLIANALNFGCTVRPNGRRNPAKGFQYEWQMHFPANMGEEKIKRIATATGCVTISRSFFDWEKQEHYERIASMVLPEHIGNAADVFDNVRDPERAWVATYRLLTL